MPFKFNSHRYRYRYAAAGEENEVAFTVYAEPDAAARVWAEIESMDGVLKVDVSKIDV